MKIAGLHSFTLSDYPGRVAAILFTAGCNFRCPFCHNGDIIAGASARELIPDKKVQTFLESRVGKLDGIVVSGGEPTLQRDLPEFLTHLKEMGFLTKLDTNGARPEEIESLLENNLLDYIAMDVKAPLERYPELAGVSVKTEKIRRSIEIIGASAVEHEFRTTMVEPLLSLADIRAIKELLPPDSHHRLQAFRPEHAFDPTLRQVADGTQSIEPLKQAQ